MYNGFVVSDKMLNNKKYDGNTNKFGITVNGIDYIVKMKKDTISSVYSEHISSRFIRNIGINCHETWIGTYKNETVVIMKDFTEGKYKLRSYKDTRQSSEDTYIKTKRYTYDDVMHMINEHSKMRKEFKVKTINQFWQMFICDAILGNRDRHHGNWGYLIIGDEYIPAPIYDNGSSLFPDVELRIGEYSYLLNIGEEYKFIEDRSERFPASLFMIKKPDGSTRRTNYNEILSDLRVNKTLARQVKSIKEKIGFEGVYRAIYNSVNGTGDIVPYEYKRFYIVICCVRYLHLIERKSIGDSYKKVIRRINNGK